MLHFYLLHHCSSTNRFLYNIHCSVSRLLLFSWHLLSIEQTEVDSINYNHFTGKEKKKKKDLKNNYVKQFLYCTTKEVASLELNTFPTLKTWKLYVMVKVTRPLWHLRSFTTHWICTWSDLHSQCFQFSSLIDWYRFRKSNDNGEIGIHIRKIA